MRLKMVLWILFRNIFQDKSYSRPEMDDLFFNSIPTDMIDWLERETDEEEIVKAMKCLDFF